MAEDCTVYRVQPDTDRGRWKLSKDGQKVDQFDLKTIAVVRGRYLAQVDQPSQLVVYDLDGKVEEEATYHDDPFPRRG